MFKRHYNISQLMVLPYVHHNLKQSAIQQIVLETGWSSSARNRKLYIPQLKQKVYTKAHEG